MPGSATSFGEPEAVGLHCFFFSKCFDRLLEDVRCSGVRRHYDSIVHPLALAPRCNNTCVAQVCEVARYLGLGRIENLNEVTDADFAIAHQVEQTKPCRISERLKEAHQVELSFCRHEDIFALTNTRVKHIVVLANML